MQPYAHLFDLTHVTVIRHGDIGIQDLLVRSMGLVTDYTSAAIDFSFLDRPVFYYQFDRTRFLGKRPSHLDLDEELPGEIVATRSNCSGRWMPPRSATSRSTPMPSASRAPSSRTATPALASGS